MLLNALLSWLALLGSLRKRERHHEALRNANVLVDIRDLWHSFGVCGASLSIRRGECLGLIGLNGSGKTTLLEILSGAVQTSGGGQNYVATVTMGYCPQGDSALDDLLTARQLLQTYAAIRGHDDVEEMLEMVDSTTELIGTLSGGQRRQLSVALAFMGSPQLVLLDEPLSGVDVQGRARIARLIEEHSGAVVVTEHRLSAVVGVCERVAVMAAGRVIFSGGVDEMRSEKAQLLLTLRFRDRLVVGEGLTTEIGERLKAVGFAGVGVRCVGNRTAELVLTAGEGTMWTCVVYDALHGVHYLDEFDVRPLRLDEVSGY